MRFTALQTLGFCLACAAGSPEARKFVPFSGIEELRPRRLEDFCGDRGSAAAGDGGGRLRWCQHSFRRTLEDGGDVELGWRMRADPDGILSIDAEAERGAAVVSCSPGALELELPEAPARRLAPGHLIFASRFAHGCHHLGQGHLYARVREVRRGSAGGGAAGSARLRLATEELASLAHAVPSLSFHFSYMPAEARDQVEHPEMRTDFGSNRELLRRRRRLMESPAELMSALQGMARAKGIEESDGGFRQGSKSAATIRNENNLLSFSPKQLSNFGWNWDFLTNATATPNFNVTVPGAEGVVNVRHPYVRVHAGIYLNFSSEFAGLKAPKVQWTAGVRGHGCFQARILASMNTTESAKVHPFSTFKLPLLESMRAPQWFEKMDLSVGSMPVSVEPGFQFDATMYHSGTFHGAMAVGGKTHGVFNPTLSYDSRRGFDVQMQATLLDSDLWPPFWMIFTKRFEIGVLFKPTFLMRGDFAGLRRSTLAIDMHPYLNVTVTRGQEPGPAQAAAEDLKTLTVYPIRVMGLNMTESSQRRYVVRIDTNARTMETSPQMNWGQVSFHDHITQFDAGKVSQEAAVTQSVVVTLTEVDVSDPARAARTLGGGEVRCTLFEDGECRPSPTIVPIRRDGAEIAAVELAVLWDDSPELWLASRVRGTAISFPEVVLREDLPHVPADAGTNASTSSVSMPLALHLIHEGITHVAPLAQGGSSPLPMFSGRTLTELGPGFLQSWRPCTEGDGTMCEPTRLELYRGSVKVAAAIVPPLVWTPHVASGEKSGLFLASGSGSSGSGGGGDLSSKQSQMLVPLHAPGSRADSVAVVKMRLAATSPMSSSLFLSPGAGAAAPLGGFQSFVWTLAGVDREDYYGFRLTVLRRARGPPGAALAGDSQPGVRGQALVPVPGASFTVRLRCAPQALGGVPDEAAPCSFEQAMALAHGRYAEGDQVVLRLQWTREGVEHEMLSPALEIAAAAAEATPLPARRLWSRDAWNARVSAHQESCSESDLHFRLGAGILVRGRVDHMGLPEGFPRLGNLDSVAPQLSTGERNIALFKPGTDARDLLPDALCEDGLCEGALPGCREAPFEKKHYPRIDFKFNRQFHYTDKGKFHGAIKEALAYAFSTLPEALDVAIREFNETRGGADRKDSTTPPPGAAGATTASPPSRPPSPPAAAAPRERTARLPFSKHWWEGVQRRLSGLQGAAREGDSRLPPAPAHLDAERVGGLPREGHVSVRFRHGVPFVVDRPLVEMMLRHGYFMDVEDDAARQHGPLHIASFSIGGQPGTAAAAGGARSGAAPSGPPRSGGIRALARASYALAALGTVAALAVEIRRRRQGESQKYSEQCQIESGLVVE